MIWLFLVFTAAAVVQGAYYSLLYARLAYQPERRFEPDDYPPLSVVICARNEAENLRRNLKVVLIQNYPAPFEVIVVNDQSEDDTLQVLDEFMGRNENLRLLNIKPGAKPLPGKKFALKTGVGHAHYDTIVVTDADCKPASAHWLEHLAAAYMTETDLVLGYSPFIKVPGLLNKLQRYENVMTAMQYFSYAMSGMPYMGVGRNMSFRRSLFESWDMKRGKGKLGGDDDLFVNARARGKHTAVCLHRDAFTLSSAPPGWGPWLRQKTRHISTSAYYRFRHKLLLFVFALSNFIFYTGFAALCLIKPTPPLLLLSVLSMALVLFAKYVVSSAVNKRLQQQDLSKWTLLLDPLYVLYLLIIFILTIIRPNPAWK